MAEERGLSYPRAAIPEPRAPPCKRAAGAVAAADGFTDLPAHPLALEETRGAATW